MYVYFFNGAARKRPLSAALYVVSGIYKLVSNCAFC